MGQCDSSYSFSFHEGGHLFGTVYPQSISPKTVSPRQLLDHRRDQVGRQLHLRAAAQDHLEPPAADLPREIPHQAGDVPVARPGEADVTVVALVGVEAEVPEEEFRTETADPVGERLRGDGKSQSFIIASGTGKIRVFP